MAGLDMDQPGPISSGSASFFGGNLTLAVNNGSLPVSRLDDMVRRIMTPFFYLGQTSYPSIDPSNEVVSDSDPSTYTAQFDISGPSFRDVRDDHAVLIREIGGASSVLLKNTGSLPLNAPKSIGVYGGDAADFADGMEPADTPIGALPVGGGSGTGRFTYLVSPLEAIKTRAQQDGSLVQYITNDTVTTMEGANYNIPFMPEVCLVFLKSYVTEGLDRLSLETDFNGTGVVNSVAQFCNNTVVVTNSGGTNTLPFASNPNVTAIIAGHLPGQEMGNAIVDVLYGTVNPSGKLPYTIGASANDYNAPVANVTITNSTDPNSFQSYFTEGLLIDYRHFDAANITPLYEFGFGLSYTTFSLTNLTTTQVISNASLTPYPPATATQPGGNPTLWDVIATITASVTNTGKVAGAAVPQLYISLPQSAVPSGTPVKTLAGFDKISLQPGETSTVTFDVVRKSLSYWDVVAQDWKLPVGSSEGISVSAGFSSRDLPLKGTLGI